MSTTKNWGGPFLKFRGGGGQPLSPLPPVLVYDNKVFSYDTPIWTNLTWYGGLVGFKLELIFA